MTYLCQILGFGHGWLILGFRQLFSRLRGIDVRFPAGLHSCVILELPFLRQFAISAPKEPSLSHAACSSQFWRVGIVETCLLPFTDDGLTLCSNLHFVSGDPRIAVFTRLPRFAYFR